MRTIDLVFDRPPGPEAPRLIEIETPDGQSVRVGTWIERPTGTWVLRLQVAGPEIQPAPDLSSLA